MRKRCERKEFRGFFSRKETRGQCHKVTKEKLLSIQEKLDKCYSKYRIIREEGISESAITCHVVKGNLTIKKLGNGACRCRALRRRRGGRATNSLSCSPRTAATRSSLRLNAWVAGTPFWKSETATSAGYRT